MYTTSYEQENKIVKPKLIGRTLRILTGISQLYFIINVVPHLDFFFSDNITNSYSYWGAALIALLLLHHVTNIGFNVNWKRKSQYLYLIIASILIIYSLIESGTIWSGYLNGLIFIVSVYFHSHLGLAHLISGLLATPGCEMKTFSHLKTILSKEETLLYVCPGHWDNLDKWEANLSWNKQKRTS